MDGNRGGFGDSIIRRELPLGKLGLQAGSF